MGHSSIFNIITPIMVGPSSSHTAGAVRIGLLAGKIYGSNRPKKVHFKLYNSFAKTGKGHGTDKGLLSGVLGFAVDDVRIKNALEIANELGVNMGPDATSRANGSVGGEITKRLVKMGEQHLGGSNYQSK